MQQFRAEASLFCPERPQNVFGENGALIILYHKTQGPCEDVF